MLRRQSRTMLHALRSTRNALLPAARAGGVLSSQQQHYDGARGFAALSIRDGRVSLWEQEYARQQELVAQALQEAQDAAEPIEVRVLLDDKQQEFYTFHGMKGVSTPIDVLKHLHDEGFAKQQALAAQLDGSQVVDLRTALDRSCSLQLLDFSKDEGKKVFWHSSAHVLGQALEGKFHEKIRLCDGPALSEGGFFYEMFLEDGLTVSETDFEELSRSIKKIVKQRQPFERMDVTREFASELFGYSDFKRQMLHKIPSHEKISLYRCGPLIDLCRGPHVPHTGVLSSFAITRCGASHWEDKDLLQRVYGISFPSNALLKEWQHLQEEAKKRDHRLIGKSQQLFMFHPLSPGSSFFLPHGTRIFNKLANFIRDEYRKRGYDEVITPLIFKKDLWETSGHLKNYHEDMFMVTQGIAESSVTHCHEHLHGDDEKVGEGGHHHHHPAPEYDQFGLKPMNCPGHCILFRESRKYSYRELPVRLADFSALHRNEASGALTGLTRVRRFHQDDAHIFCTSDQVQHEISQCLQFIQHVYGVFGFTFQLRLSTRPENYMGELAVWDDAESQLRKALEDFGEPWDVNEGDGAFYGPKIDIVVTDALKRQHQCGTIQLDFQLPKNFELSYDGADGHPHTPIIIHRAVLGSIERMMAILIEHTGGKWPLWLSPRQVAVLPVSETHRAYAKQVASTLEHDANIFVDVQDSSKTLNKRIREAQLAGYNFILVVGDKEVEASQVNIRTRDNQVHGAKSLDTFVSEVKAAITRLDKLAHDKLVERAVAVPAAKEEQVWPYERARVAVAVRDRHAVRQRLVPLHRVQVQHARVRRRALELLDVRACVALALVAARKPFFTRGHVRQLLDLLVAHVERRALGAGPATEHEHHFAVVHAHTLAKSPRRVLANEPRTAPGHAFGVKQINGFVVDRQRVREYRVAAVDDHYGA